MDLRTLDLDAPPPKFAESTNGSVSRLRLVTDLAERENIPELQRRGLFRTAYEGTTLRDNLGLARPPSRYAAKVESVTAAE